MAIFCIPPKYIEKLKTSALAKEVDLNELYKMDSKERREFFSKFTDKEIGKFINTKFEQAIVSKQQNAILDWAQSVFTPKQKQAVRYKNVLDKVKALEDLGMLNGKAENAFLEDLVMDKLGISITAEEMQTITEKATKVEEAQKAVGDNLNNPEYEKETIAYYKALKEVNDYMESLNPANQLGLMLGTVTSGNMLFSPKSVLLNVGSNAILGTAEAVVRRVAMFQFRGTDNKLARDYVKMAIKVYNQTGFDISRMTLQDGTMDLGTAGSRTLGNVQHAQGKGPIRKLARFQQTVVFKYMMGFGDAVFAALAFADTINLQTASLFKDKQKGREVMIDAMRAEPESDIGKVVKAQGIHDAEVATWTNKSVLATATSKLRGILNESTNIPGVGELRLGDAAMRFVKTPSNVISTGIEYGGGGVVKGLWELGRMYRNKDFGKKSDVQRMMRHFVRAGFGLAAVWILAMNTDDDDYRGAFEAGAAQLEKSKNSVVNAFRVGDKWISTDWLGPLASSYNAVMYAKKYGSKGTEESVFQYITGLGSNLEQLPGIEDLLRYGQEKLQRQDLSLEDATGAFGAWLVNQGSSMIVPSFVSDIAKSIDSNERKTENALEAVQAKIPVARNFLPTKRNIFGEDLETEGPISTLLFGARVKTDKEDSTLKELSRVVDETEKNINFTDWEKSSSLKLAQFRDKVGETKYEKATIEYGKTLKNDLKTLFKSAEYKNMDVDKQLNAINGLDTKAQEKVFEKYNFTYKTKKK